MRGEGPPLEQQVAVVAGSRSGTSPAAVALGRGRRKTPAAPAPGNRPAALPPRLPVEIPTPPRQLRPSAGRGHRASPESHRVAEREEEERHLSRLPRCGVLQPAAGGGEAGLPAVGCPQRGGAPGRLLCSILIESFSSGKVLWWGAENRRRYGMEPVEEMEGLQGQ